MTISLLFLFSLLSAETFCALTVELRDSADQPAEGTVEILDVNGAVRDRRHDVSGVVNFCDLKETDYSVVAYSSNCHRTRLDGLRSFWPNEEKLRLTVYPCSHEIAPLGCRIEFRVVSEKGEPVKAREVTVSGVPRLTDSFGRVWVATRFGRSINAVVIDGEHRSVTTAECHASQPLLRKIILLKGR